MGEHDDAIVSSPDQKPKDEFVETKKVEGTVTENTGEESTAKPHASIIAVQGEKAAQFLANVGEDRSFTFQEEKAVVKRIDRRVLVLLLGAYFFQQLDKSSLSYVSIFGLTEDANLEASEYSWLGSILYLAQLVMQPLSAFLLVKAPTGKLIAGAIFLWGSSLALMAACNDFKSLLGLRFTLGAFEAMIG